MGTVADMTLGEATAESPLIRDHMRPGPGAYNLTGSLGPQPLSTVKTSYGYSMGKSEVSRLYNKWSSATRARSRQAPVGVIISPAH